MQEPETTQTTLGSATKPATPPETVIVALTYAKIDPAQRRVFDEYSRNVIRSLTKNDGFIGYSLRTKLLANEVWTMTVWRDDASADAFVRSPTHREAMRQGLSAVRTGKFHRVKWPADKLPPSWAEMKLALEEVEFVEYKAGRIVPADPGTTGSMPTDANSHDREAEYRGRPAPSTTAD